MIKGKTKTGFEYEIKKESLNNYELLENIAELEENPLSVTSIVKHLLGKEQAKTLKEHVRNENGIVEIDKMTEEITEMLNNGSQETKNS